MVKIARDRRSDSVTAPNGNDGGGGEREGKRGTEQSNGKKHQVGQAAIRQREGQLNQKSEDKLKSIIIGK